MPEQNYYCFDYSVIDPWGKRTCIGHLSTDLHVSETSTIVDLLTPTSTSEKSDAHFQIL